MSKRCHMADKISNEGTVSPVCRDIEHPVNLARETWTNRSEAVTCPYCIDKLATSKQELSE